jgi:hypothetical protein
MKMMAAIGLATALAGAALARGAAPTLLHVSSHLPHRATVWVDSGKAVSAPGEGSTSVPITAGHHLLKVRTSTGVTYQADLELKPEALMTWKGHGYWCVNLLERSVDVYSTENCEEDVTDAG